MDLRETAEEAAFRDEVRAFLNGALTDELREAALNCAGVYCDYPVAVRWHRILAARGWSAPAWPVEWGGPGWSFVQQHIFEQELEAAGAPRITPNNVRMVGPVIMKFGTPEQKAHYLPRILSGEDWWAQGYSEPGAGSDLAALQCAAVRDGDDYIINGTKIWTSHAQWSNKIFCLVRTSREGPPQAGISFLLLDMNLPGISVQPIISLAGDHETNQVFFDDVRAPASGLLGEENSGWKVAKYLLEHERGFVWSPSVRARLRRIRASGDVPPPVQSRLAAAEISLQALELAELRALAHQARGEPAGVSASVLKIQGSELRQLVSELAIEAAGASIAAPRGALAEADAAALTMAIYLNDRAASIYAGANEIQRNIVARALLRG